MRRITTRQLTFAALFAALAIVLSVYPFTFYLPSGSRITFREIPIYLCSFSFGPVIGGICAAVSDFIGTLITNSGKPWDPLFFINAVLTGVLPGILFKYVFREKRDMIYIVSSIIPVNLFVSLFLTTLWFHIDPFNPFYKATYGHIPFGIHLLMRSLLVATLTTAQIIAVRFLYPVVRHFLYGEEIKLHREIKEGEGK